MSVVQPLQPIFILDCSHPFDPTEFINKDVRIWFGPSDGDGLSGEPDVDPRADSLVKIDFTSQALFEHCLKEGENSIEGEEKLRRLKEREETVIRHGGRQFLALWNDWREKGEDSVLEYLRKTCGITYLDFPGLVLRRSNGFRYLVSLHWFRGEWDWHYVWLDNDWTVRLLSVSSTTS